MNAPRSLLVGILVLLAMPGLAPAQSIAEVRDGASLFTADTIARVNKQLQSLRRDYQRDLLIETVKEVPPEVRKALAAANRRQKIARIFANLSEKLAEEHNINGVYILISTQPSYKWVQVTAWPAEDAVLKTWQSEALRRHFVNKEKHSGPNQALVEMVTELSDFLQVNLRPNSPSIRWETLVMLIVGLVVVWIVALVIRGRLQEVASADQSTAAAPGPEKVLPGVLGGMFGSMAGFWIYDQALLQLTEASPPAADASVITRGFPLPLLNSPPTPVSDHGSNPPDPLDSAEVGQNVSTNG